MRFLTSQKHTWDGLWKSPSFVITIVTTMGITLGSLLCVLTLGYLLLLEPLPYPDQDKLFRVDHTLSDKTGKSSYNAFTYPTLIHLYDNQDVFSESALIYYSQDVLTSHPKQPRMQVNYVTPEWFSLMGTSMVLGRYFEDTESIDTNNPVAILTYDTWQNEYSGDKDILEKKVDFSGVSYRIIGVLSQNEVEPQIRRNGQKASVFLPWDYNLATGLKETWGRINNNLAFVGKLSDDYSSSNADKKITPLVNATWQDRVASSEYFKGWSIDMELVSFQSAIMGDNQSTIYLLIVGVMGLVLIAGTNITNLFMSRTAEKQRSLAIRAALGATKFDLFKTLFAESAQLMIFSIIIALTIANGGFYLIQSYLSETLPRIEELSFNAFTLGAAIFCAFFFAVIFAGLSSRIINYRKLNSTLQSSGKGTGVQISKRIRQVLIGFQIAVAMTLIFVNINIFKHAINKIDAPMGFSIDNIQYLGMAYSSGERPNREERTVVIDEIIQHLKQIPTVEDITISGSPFWGLRPWILTDLKTNTQFTPSVREADDNYFQMIEQPILEGDFFSEADIRDTNDVIIVNDVFAKQIAFDGSAIGMVLSSGGDKRYTIVGVVKGILIPGSNEVPMMVYRPARMGNYDLLVKLKPNQVLLREQVVDVIKEVNSQYTLYGLQSLDDAKTELLFSQITTAITTAVLAVLSLFLAAVGLFGILGYSTQMRRFELGTRMAIGAKPNDLIRLLMLDNAKPLFSGMGISIVAMVIMYINYAELLTDYISIQLLPLFLLTFVFIGIITLFACYIPLRQYIKKPIIYVLRGNN